MTDALAVCASYHPMFGHTRKGGLSLARFQRLYDSDPFYYAYHYLPVALLLSSPIDEAVAERYERARWLPLRGTVNGTPLDSAYKFASDVIGYDLAAFFERNSATLKAHLQVVLRHLLSEG